MSSPPGDRHGWNSLDHYLTIHESILDDFREFFIEEDGLDVKLVNPDALMIAGRIRCTGDLFLDVHKILAINDRNQVRTIWYSYQACIDTDQTIPIFRYDNAHQYTREHHADAHHKHVFDPVTGSETPSSLIWVGYDHWPALADVLHELHEWQLETGQHRQDIR